MCQPAATPRECQPRSASCCPVWAPRPCVTIWAHRSPEINSRVLKVQMFCSMCSISAGQHVIRGPTKVTEVCATLGEHLECQSYFEGTHPCFIGGLGTFSRQRCLFGIFFLVADFIYPLHPTENTTPLFAGCEERRAPGRAGAVTSVKQRRRSCAWTLPWG